MCECGCYYGRDYITVEIGKVKIESLTNKNYKKADEEVLKLVSDEDFLNKMYSYFKVGEVGTEIIFKQWFYLPPKEEILEKMRDILKNALHNVTIAVPDITDLQDLYLYEVRSSVNMKISCVINPGMEDHADLLEEYESLDNINIRAYESEDRFLIVRDGEELMMAVIGNDENNHLVFHTKDPNHIRLFNALAMETWMRSRKI